MIRLSIMNRFTPFLVLCLIGISSCQDNKCEQEITESVGYVTSPNFPDSLRGADCAYHFHRVVGQIIKLVFDHLFIGTWNECSAECESSYVALYDGNSTSSKFLGKFCCLNSTRLIVSSTNHLYMHFKTVNETAGAFMAHYRADVNQCAENNGGCQHECFKTMNSLEPSCSCREGFRLLENGRNCKEECYHEITAATGSFSSPKSQGCPRYGDCAWNLQTRPGHKIKVVFEKFNTDTSPTCQHNYIAVYDGNSSSSKLLGKLCSHKDANPITSSSNQLYIVYKSDGSYQNFEFSANHTTV